MKTSDSYHPTKGISLRGSIVRLYLGQLLIEVAITKIGKFALRVLLPNSSSHVSCDKAKLVGVVLVLIILASHQNSVVRLVYLGTPNQI